MKNAYIFDLDGTLLDSYPVIVESAKEALEKNGVSVDPEVIYETVIHTSVYELMNQMSIKAGKSADELFTLYRSLSAGKKDRIGLMTHAKEMLSYHKGKGHRLFVYTHRGETTEPILKRLGIYDDFQEIVTSEENFPRKPAPEALLYLMEKYQLNPDFTYYIGDRKIDMMCAKNAGIQGILFCRAGSYTEKTGLEDLVVEDLREI